MVVKWEICQKKGRIFEIIFRFSHNKLKDFQISKGKKGRHRQVIDIIVYLLRLLQICQEFLPCY